MAAGKRRIVSSAVMGVVLGFFVLLASPMRAEAIINYGVLATMHAYYPIMTGAQTATASSVNSNYAAHMAMGPLRLNNSIWERIYNATIGFLQEAQAVDRTLVSMEDLYYMIQAFQYLHDNGGILGAIQVVSEGTSMASGVLSSGMDLYQSGVQAFVPNASQGKYLIPADTYAAINGWSNAVSGLAGGLGQSAQALSMLSNENSGVPFLEVVNGAQMGVQASIIGAQAINNFAAYGMQRDQQAATEQQIEWQHEADRIQSQLVQAMNTPCRNMPVYFDPALETATALATCATMSPPPYLDQSFTEITGTGRQQAVANAQYQSCLNNNLSLVQGHLPAAACIPPPSEYTPPTLNTNPTLPTPSMGVITPTFGSSAWNPTAAP